MAKKLFVITVDVGDRPEWQIKALQRQFADAIKKCDELKDHFFLLFPVRNQPSNIFYLDGDPESVSSAKELADIADIVRPVLKEPLNEIDQKNDKSKSSGSSKGTSQVLE